MNSLQDEAMTRKTRKIFSQIIELQSAAFSNRLNQLLSTLNSHLAAMKRHEAWLDEKLTAANLDPSLGMSITIWPNFHPFDFPLICARYPVCSWSVIV